ncbi:MAG: hypothetical protein GYB68_10435 [Chloroflexi bacterium]|nr:hypothetical protein [Chloroflexota bacterium]
MPIAINWLEDANAILLWTYEGNWTWDELTSGAATQADMLEGLPHQVFGVHDFSRAENPPEKLIAKIPQLMPPHTSYPPNLADFYVIVGGSTFVRKAGGLLSRLLINLAFVDSIDEALAAIEEYKKRPRGTGSLRLIDWSNLPQEGK